MYCTGKSGFIPSGKTGLFPEIRNMAIIACGPGLPKLRAQPLSAASPWPSDLSLLILMCSVCLAASSFIGKTVCQQFMCLQNLIFWEKWGVVCSCCFMCTNAQRANAQSGCQRKRVPMSSFMVRWGMRVGNLGGYHVLIVTSSSLLLRPSANRVGYKHCW